MHLNDFDYTLPEGQIAQTPIEPRDSARLMVVNRATGQIDHAQVRDVPFFLRAGDAMIFNDTRVIPARLWARKTDTGGRVELLLLRRRAPMTWEVLVGGKGVTLGVTLTLENAAQAGVPDLLALVVEQLDGPRRVVQFSRPITPLLDKLGEMPLPPYIHEALADRERYQTVFAHTPGSAAAPTAGLHFTPELLDRIRASGLHTGFLTLHVGLDTFAPVKESDPTTHAMHGEYCDLPTETAALINHTRGQGGRVVAVGTTAVRTLESAPWQAGQIQPFASDTHLFIYPGHTFRAVDVMFTNFHLPRTTLLMLVAAFAGRELILHAYNEAVRAGYRFYSFGDAMLIV